MNFNSLSKYVYQKYGLKFKPAMPGSTEFYVLPSPLDGSYFAMLSRIKKSEVGLANTGYTPVLDLKCGAFSSVIRDLPGFSSAFRLKSSDWVGVSLVRGNKEAIENALDYAFKLAMNDEQTPVMNQQYLYVPDQQSNGKYQAQKIRPRQETITKRKKSTTPAAIKKMLASYDYSILPAKGREKNFYRQGQMMADFADDYQDFAAFKRYYPTYHDMTVAQLRTYFTWRQKIRQGHYEKTSTSYAYVYIYELLNQIGVSDPQTGLKKLQAFMHNYAQKYDLTMTTYLKLWLQDYVLYYHLDQEIKKAFAKEIARDHCYHLLLQPANYQASDIFAALVKLSPYLASSLSVKKRPKQMRQLVYQVWLALDNLKQERGLSFFHQYLAHRNLLVENLFAGAVFYEHRVPAATKYQIDDERSFFYQNNHWYCSSLIPNKRQKTNLNAFMHEVDRLARIYFHLGRPLKERKIEAAYLAAIKKGITQYQKLELEAKRPKIKINFADLGKIRADASQTRESLLTDEEKELEQEDVSPQPQPKKEKKPAAEPKQNETQNSHGLDQDELYFLRALLKKQPWQVYLKKHHLMASILADEINDKLFDEIGDSVIEFDENDQPRIISDYQTDLTAMFLNNKEG